MADIPTQNFDLYADRRERIAAMIARRNFIVRPGNRGQKPIDLTGKKFGRLFIVSLASKKPEYRYVCACDCGNITTVYGKNLRNGHHITCGCRQPRHNMSGTPIYKVWVSMNGRCRSHKNYSGRGITVCDEWRKSFPAFAKWALANGYRKGLDIDRRNNDGNYEPGNCRWITRQQNLCNTRRSLLVEHEGKIVTIKELSMLTGRNEKTLGLRFHRGLRGKQLIAPSRARKWGY